MGARLLLGLLWLLHWLPLPLQAALGRGLGRFLHALPSSRRRIARRNVELCFPEKTEAEVHALVRDHFGWLARSLLERGLLWYASPERLRRLIQIDGNVHFAEQSARPVMWLVPHFMSLDVAAASLQLFQRHMAVSIYQAQSNKVMDAALRRGRLRLGRAEIFPRSDKSLALVKAIKRGDAFFNLPDMDFGERDAGFVPFFGIPAATLLAPSRLARALGMVVQPVVAEALPGGRGYRVRFLPHWEHFPTDDPYADTLALNRWIEAEIRRNPAQYLWVHRRFKTRPAGEPSLY